ncbi:hypothetical protein QQP08_023253 [Theobroma cacao]|nr:hypothetical protein QQP08_023253 [Theobroma cacao]
MEGYLSRFLLAPSFMFQLIPINALPSFQPVDQQVRIFLNRLLRFPEIFPQELLCLLDVSSVRPPTVET